MIGLRIRADGEAFGKAVRADLQRLKRATTLAVREATTGLKLSLRGQARAAGLGSRMANALRGDAYPDKPGAYSLRAAGEVYTKWARKTEKYGLVDVAKVFFEGATIRSKAGWLAIPTEAARRVAGARVSRRYLSPTEIEAALRQDLELVAPPGSPGVVFLVAPSVMDSHRAGKLVGSTPRRRAQGRQEIAPVVMFVLVRQVSLRRRLDGDTAAATWAGMIPQLIAARLGQRA